VAGWLKCALKEFSKFTINIPNNTATNNFTLLDVKIDFGERDGMMNKS